ncbi:pentatricopeptide repeat-containing protein At4g21065-like [Magnolia sinica]|uniref:pentatricopeptide repeat-containing protein At4g21065-like n=1 Tax=Magnolia sinica TaxID=86752 RepID=UPI0026583D9C|nr:pentatricopeptide repeat-containing protein At4g21065-like [Magnolia sinica]
MTTRLQPVVGAPIPLMHAMLVDEAAISTISTLLRLSSTLHHLNQIHSRILLLGLQSHYIITTHLISSFFLRFLAVDHAFSIYAHFPYPIPIHSTNSILQSLADTSPLQPLAFFLYLLHMRKVGTVDPTHTTRPNRFTFPPLLKACTLAFPSSVGPTQGIHTHVVKFGTHADVYVGTALMDSYSKHGDAGSALRVFDEMSVRNVVSWNSIVSGLAKCGDLVSARRLFEEMPERNVVSWTSLISGYAQNGYFYETLSMFEDMRSAGVKPNDVTMVSVLSACANLGALGLGRRIHSFLEDNGFGLNLFVGSALIDMYSKCGMVGDALHIFHRMRERNVVACSAMIMGLAMNGRATEALAIFEEMRMRGMVPNDITFIGVLCACCHAGLVEKGYHYFHLINREYSLLPKLQHYACMVDLLGRAGHLGDAYLFIMVMPIEPDVVVWGALLGACRIHHEFELGEHAAHRILELDPRHCGSLVFLSNVYARVGDKDGIRNVKQMMGISRTKKMPAKSWMEVNDVVHQFFAGDTSHPQNDRIYSKLDELAKQLEHEGYLPNTNSVVFSVEEEEKERSMYFHSEKIAIAFGLISTPKGSSIRIVKNLRVCDDCHSVVKLISKIEKREIVLRDSNRFHHFVGGMCSCRDYW